MKKSVDALMIRRIIVRSPPNLSIAASKTLKCDIVSRSSVRTTRRPGSVAGSGSTASKRPANSGSWSLRIATIGTSKPRCLSARASQAAGSRLSGV